MSMRVHVNNIQQYNKYIWIIVDHIQYSLYNNTLDYRNINIQ